MEILLILALIVCFHRVIIDILVGMFIFGASYAGLALIYRLIWG